MSLYHEENCHLCILHITFITCYEKILSVLKAAQDPESGWFYLKIVVAFSDHVLTLGPVAYKPNFGLYMQELFPDHSPNHRDTDGLIIIINTLFVLNGLGSISSNLCQILFSSKFINCICVKLL